ncbi:DNA-binding transcriptional regulator, LysR family [Shimia gijangensis]|uniref:DNA-binding transcriptional regulator, LysR family n=1 Tax=Shimia gijangensis TaxID=1470563 RepID=A0A1M6SIS5_9RHOB|nr:LysR family transcriptional regulator [Shimia gijangensis]SHK44605.1 DNA-binding transcriptional regulator, LysR family [Shimia gijangensis]
MKKIDNLSIDSKLLRTFLAVLDERSATQAAARLGVTQSTVSHSLSRLRQQIGDPLFVRSGQALLPTEVALSLRKPVQAILDGIASLTDQRDFDPQQEAMQFVIAANDMQRDLIFPKLIQDLRSEGVSASFEFIASGHPSADMMRDDRCDLVLTPFPPNTSDVIQRPILSSRMMCFFDENTRSAPKTWEEYCNADHLAVRFRDGGTSLRALRGIDTSDFRPASITVPNFSAIPQFIKGTTLIATEMGLMQLKTLSGLSMESLPIDSDPVVIYLAWHQRSSNDPSHIWLRNKVRVIAEEVMAEWNSLSRRR